MKNLLALLALLFCSANIQAQNIEGQIIASQYGTWKVPGYAPNTYSSFAPTSCRVQGGASFFFAFAAGTPVQIVDSNPSATETVTPSAVVDTNVTCAISIAPVNPHQLPFYFTSATGGLQEAINQNLTTPQSNTILLDNAFYQLVGGATNAAAVIAAAKGSVALGLVDVTQVPTIWYRWNGTQYVAVSSATSGGTTLVNDIFSNGPSNAWQDLFDFVATGPVVYNPQAAVNAAQANNGSVTIQPGAGRTPFTNTGNVRVADNRTDVPATARSATEFGATCDLRSVYGTFTSGSTTVTILGGYSALFSAADIGRTLVAVGVVAGTPTAFETTIQSITDSQHASVTTPAPFTQSTAHQMDLGHDDTAAIAQGMTVEAGNNGELIFPQGDCLTHTQTLLGQSIQGLGPPSFVTNFPGEDLFAAPDPSLTQGVSQGGAHLHDLTINLDDRIDATQAWQIINDSGTTAKAAMYRPIASNSGLANNPVAPGWFLGGYNGAAAITASSAVICVPATETAPAIGQTIVFPYLANVFTATVSSTAGSCAGGASTRTLSSALPSGSTNSQAEWFAGTAPQTINATVSGSGCPASISLTNSILPVPYYESNVAPFGLIQIDGEQFTYFGKTNATGSLSSNTLTITGCAQNGTTRAVHTAGATVVPLNPFQPAYPWPVTPTLNTGDTTPAGTASYYPAWNVGNTAFAFPVATGSNAGTGATGSWTTGAVIESMTIQPWPIDINPGFGGNAVNHVAGFYFVQYPYAARFQHLNLSQLFYGVAEGLPSIENGNWATAEPTADGGSWENVAIRAANPWNFIAGNQNTFKDFNVYSEEGSVGGSALGADTCYYFTAPRNDQTGGQAEQASLVDATNLYCEPETGAHAGSMPNWEWDIDLSVVHDMHMGGGGEVYIGGGGQHWIGGNFNNSANLPAINWGQGNTADLVSTLGTEPKSNSYGSSSLINWNYNSKFSGTTVQAFSNPGGPYGQLQVGNSREPIPAQTNETFNTGNLTAPYVSSGGGFIAPEEFDASTSFDSAPMSAGWTFDDTSPITHSYTACNVSTSVGTTYCNSYRFNNSQIPIGPGQRLVPGKYTMYLSVKDVATASNTQRIVVYSNCGGVSDIFAVPMTNAWPTTLAGYFSAPVDLTAATGSGCYLGLQFNGATTADTVQYGFLDFAPLAESLNAQTINAITINLPSGPTGGTVSGCAQSPVTGIADGFTCPTKGWGTGLNASQGASDSTATLVTTSGLSTQGCFFVDAEYECYTGIAGNVLTGITRGEYTTTATTHSSGAPVVSVDLVLGSIQQAPANVIAGGASTPSVLSINNGFPSTHNGTSVMDVNGGSNELWFDSGGHITQANSGGVNQFAAPISVGNHGTLAIANTQLVVQDNGPNEVTSPLGLGAGHTGTLNVVQTPTIGAPVVINFATGAGSNTYSYVCAGTDYDGNLINGTTTTITGVPTVFGGPNPFIGVSCPWSAGVYSFQVYRTAGGPSQGLMNSTVGNPGGFTDFNGAASGGTPPAANNSNPKIVVNGSGTPTMQLGPTNISTGTGAPASTCGTAPIGSGSLWLRTDGGASTSLYSCAGTTWTAVTIP
jgi:hypothetical protein